MFSGRSANLFPPWDESPTRISTGLLIRAILNLAVSAQNKENTSCTSKLHLFALCAMFNIHNKSIAAACFTH